MAADSKQFEKIIFPCIVNGCEFEIEVKILFKKVNIKKFKMKNLK